MSGRCLVLFSISIALTACGCSSGDLNDVFGNEQAMATVKKATSVKAYRLPPESYYQESLDEYKIAAGPIDVPNDLAEKLRKLLLDETFYVWDGDAKGCEPDFGVRIQFSEGDHTVDVLFCFECYSLLVFHNGKNSGSGHFDDSVSRIVPIVQKLFPDDDVIQSLK